MWAGRSGYEATAEWYEASLVPRHIHRPGASKIWVVRPIFWIWGGGSPASIQSHKYGIITKPSSGCVPHSGVPIGSPHPLTIRQLKKKWCSQNHTWLCLPCIHLKVTGHSFTQTFNSTLCLELRQWINNFQCLFKVLRMDVGFSGAVASYC